MKVGTDGVLLGAWTPLRDSDRRILDIGTGTGLIALMLAQRAPGPPSRESISMMSARRVPTATLRRGATGSRSSAAPCRSSPTGRST